MAFGIPGSDSGSGGEFLGRLQFDGRSGLWKFFTRVMEGGSYKNVESEDLMNPSFLMDFGSLEVGYAKISSPPSFLMVPYGQAVPPRPQEMTTDDRGKQKNAFSPAARLKVMSPKTFGDSEPRYFMLASKTGLPSIEEAWNMFTGSPEAADGSIPIVTTTTRTVEVKTPQGTSKFKVPVFTFVQWMPRPEALGERLVPIPAFSAQQQAKPAPQPHTQAAPPPNHVPPPQQTQARQAEPAPF